MGNQDIEAQKKAIDDVYSKKSRRNLKILGSSGLASLLVAAGSFWVSTPLVVPNPAAPHADSSQVVEYFTSLDSLAETRENIAELLGRKQLTLSYIPEEVRSILNEELYREESLDSAISVYRDIETSLQNKINYLKEVPIVKSTSWWVPPSFKLALVGAGLAVLSYLGYVGMGVVTETKKEKEISKLEKQAQVNS
ncbi:MAG TPA: hypothetical protein ENH99_02065 [Candidatus Pacearchaeota archaeon]|nr:hypothetical protein [Candidatus Pacearchaeota archaeon]